MKTWKPAKEHDEEYLRLIAERVELFRLFRLLKENQKNLRVYQYQQPNIKHE